MTRNAYAKYAKRAITDVTVKCPLCQKNGETCSLEKIAGYIDLMSQDIYGVLRSTHSLVNSLPFYDADWFDEFLQIFRLEEYWFDIALFSSMPYHNMPANTHSVQRAIAGLTRKSENNGRLMTTAMIQALRATVKYQVVFTLRWKWTILLFDMCDGCLQLFCDYLDRTGIDMQQSPDSTDVHSVTLALYEYLMHDLWE